MDVTNYLPVALWMQILSVLPVKSLIVARTVCKFFLTVIDDPSFVSFHTQTFPANLNESRMLILRYQRETNSDWETNCEIVENENAQLVTKRTESPSYFKSSDWFIAGSVNGLLLLVSRSGNFIWNPSITKFRTLPHPSELSSWRNGNRFERLSLGFGYHESSNDYKVLAIMDHVLYDNEPPFGDHPADKADDGVWVYSVKTDSWTTVGFPACRDKRKMSAKCCFKNGLVWIEGVDTGHSYYHHLTRFDFTTEKFNYIPVPYPIKCNLWVENRLIVVDGGSSLAVSGMDSNSIVSVWAMDAKTSSWNKIYNIGEGLLQMKVFENKEMIMEYWSKLTKTKVSLFDETERVHNEIYYAGTYVESLVLLN